MTCCSVCDYEKENIATHTFFTNFPNLNPSYGFLIQLFLMTFVFSNLGVAAYEAGKWYTAFENEKKKGNDAGANEDNVVEKSEYRKEAIRFKKWFMIPFIY